MTWLGKLNRLLRQDRAAIAALAAAFLTAAVALTGAAVDIGLLAATRAELQNAADAAALAGAATLIYWDEDLVVWPDPYGALDTAQQVAWANKAQGVNLELLPQDVTLGLWLEDSQAFDPYHIGPSCDPDFLSACQVTLRRDTVANSPVDTIFAGVVGISQVNLSATATAHLGWAGSVTAGQVDLPIAVNQDAISSPSGPTCGEAITFHSENDENAEWTSFFTSPANDPNVKKYVNGTWETPEMKVGDQINVINGNLSNNTFNALASRFQAEGTDYDGDGNADMWEVLLPVVDPGGGGASTATVVGFARAAITEVRTAPYKDIVATLLCGMVVPASQTGGGNFGSRAATPKLVQ
jgi:Flp pilus assembly protein TadG